MARSLWIERPPLAVRMRFAHGAKGVAVRLPDADDSPCSSAQVEAAAAAVAGLAHDLRAPLAAVHAATELLAQDLDHLDATQIREMALTIRRGIRRFEELTENLYSWIALRERRLEVHRAPLDLRELVEECASLMGPVLVAKGQHWVLHQPTPLPPVLADRQLIGRVCLNLLANASKFAAPGTSIESILTRSDDAAHVVIQDRGPGLPPGDTARLFEAFYQGPNGAPRGGVGLGLGIVRALVQAHGGRVGAATRRGGGARVWFELPLAHEGVPGPVELRQASQPWSRTPPRPR
jgi:two-component system, OmpR family, sensor histidine kinase KdpD